MLTDNLLQELKNLAIVAWPKEACALLTEDKVYPLVNLSEDTEAFEICPISLAMLLPELGTFDKVQYLWHSHTKEGMKGFDLRTPSEADILLYQKFKIPLLISGFDGNVYLQAVEFPKPFEVDRPLLNRPYICGIFDCGTLICDHWFREFGIKLHYSFKPEYLHLRNWAKAVEEFLETNCFYEVKTSLLQENDILVIPFLNLLYAHGVLVLGNTDFVLDQQKFSLFVPSERYLAQPHKVFRFDKELFLSHKEEE